MNADRETQALLWACAFVSFAGAVLATYALPAAWRLVKKVAGGA